MQVNVIAMTVLVSMVAAQGAYAQDTDITSKAFMEAALTVRTFDYYATKCKQGSGFAANDAAKIEAWQTANGVAQIRMRLRDLDRYPTQKQQLDEAVANITQKIAGQYANLDACTAALLVSKLPAAQFATVSPQLLASPSKPPKTPNKTERSPAVTPGIASSQSDAKIVAQIDSFGFNSRPKVGIGGFIALDIYPVVLFRNGDALTNVEGLSFGGGLAAHKRANPDEWTRWRRQGGKLQLAQKDGWKALPFQTTYPKLPNDFRLNGLFRSLSGTGTVAIGGNQSIAAWQDYRFSADGQVVRGNGAGGRAESGDTSIATSNTAPNQRGRYRIEGLTLYITYEDGSSERRILITDPKDPKSVIWLDGVSYVHRKQ
ncbi:hypothetical protein IQ276_024455 [Desmonostoc muscorum LEGE 12446]|uniref:Uncharacterized protein n=1 Tax=Desmonostoc muscorum LEGE 12446 TaxID=1828758 RepID=A0A8J6ZZB0_DESMC|nr:hypothetical protein [Desmonostoc muscorum]MCF2149525.1 hypothetical protein [Desmonostoc muscorum LEGE 12446]